MAVQIFATADGGISSTNATYLTARSGSSLSATNNADEIVGQDLAVNYHVYEGFLSFDTSVLSGQTVDSVVLSLEFDVDVSTTNFTIEARLWPWASGGLLAGDWLAGASAGAQTLLATLSTAGLSLNTYQAFTSTGSFVGAINTTGVTDIVLISDRSTAGTTPTGDEYVYFTTIENATRLPKLRVETINSNAAETMRFVTSPNRW